MNQQHMMKKSMWKVTLLLWFQKWRRQFEHMEASLSITKAIGGIEDSAFPYQGKASADFLTGLFSVFHLTGQYFI